MHSHAERAAANRGREGMIPARTFLFRTRSDTGLAMLRLLLAAVIFPHGAQHLVGWFGGYGYEGTREWMTGLGFPGPLATLAIVTEFVAPIALALGMASRVAALGIIGIMAGAVKVHFSNGFFMNWFGAIPAGMEGYEYHILVVALALVVVLRGGGRWSLDEAIAWSLEPKAGSRGMRSRPRRRESRAVGYIP